MLAKTLYCHGSSFEQIRQAITIATDHLANCLHCNTKSNRVISIIS